MEEKGGAKRCSALDYAGLFFVTATAIMIRLPRITFPRFLYFDEAIYRKDACQYLEIPGANCALPYPPTETHPPLGKWLMAASMRLFGDSPLGWRAAAVAAGCIGVAVLFILSRRLLSSPGAALFVSLLWAFDPLHFGLSRIGMLEMFVPTFGLIGVLLLLSGLESRGRRKLFLLTASGVAFGCVIASKWSGVLYLGLGATYLLRKNLMEARAQDEPHPFDSMIRGSAVPALVALTLAPLVIYIVTFLGRIDSRSDRDVGRTWISSFYAEQKSMLQTHFYLPGSNALSSPAIGWPLGHGSFDMIDQEQEAAEGSIVLTANRPLWIMGLMSLVLVGLSRIRRREAGWLALAGWAWMYIPWVALLVFQEVSLGTHREATYLYYMLPATPFMYLSMGAVLDGMTGRERSLAAITVALVSGVGFVLLYPNLAYVST